MYTLSEIHEIAEFEARDEDTITDIKDVNLLRRRLWISAFIVGYQMGQAGVDKYEDMP